MVTLGRWTCTLLLGVILNGCSRSSKQVEIPGPKETVVLELVNVSDQKVGSLYIENIDGRARARISMDNGHYQPGLNMRATITVNSSNGTAVYAHCNDVDGNTGKCTTFPITVLSDKSHALYETITGTTGLVFNVLDAQNNVYARSARHTIVIDN